jgi:hypothetical protein
MNNKVQTTAQPGAVNQGPGQSKAHPPFDPTKLLTATEKAVRAVGLEPTTTSGKVLAEIGKPKATALNAVRSRHIWPEEIFRDGRMVQHDPVKTVAQVVGRLEIQPATLDKLRDYQTTMLTTLAETEKFTSKAAHDRFMAQISSLDAESLSDEIRLRSRDAVSADYRAKQGALVKKLVRLTEEHIALCKPILDEARQRVAAWLEKREAADRSECEAFGIPFHASAPWQAACHLAMRITDARIPKPGQWELPSRVLSGIVNISTK